MTVKVKNNEYSNALDGFKDAFEDKDLEALEKRIQSRRLVKTLINMRVAKNLTQSQLASLAGVNQSKISRLENGEDRELKIEDIELYAKATSSEFTLLISEEGKTLADQIKYHAVSIRQAFLKLAELSHQDETIATGVAQLHEQAFINLNMFLKEAAEKFPKQPSNGEPYIKIAMGSPRNPTSKKKKIKQSAMHNTSINQSEAAPLLEK